MCVGVCVTDGAADDNDFAGTLRALLDCLASWYMVAALALSGTLIELKPDQLGVRDASDRACCKRASI